MILALIVEQIHDSCTTSAVTNNSDQIKYGVTSQLYIEYKFQIDEDFINYSFYYGVVWYTPVYLKILFASHRQRLGPRLFVYIIITVLIN